MADGTKTRHEFVDSKKSRLQKSDKLNTRETLRVLHTVTVESPPCLQRGLCSLCQADHIREELTTSRNKPFHPWKAPIAKNFFSDWTEICLQ
jgi:hypothetical protein